MWDTQYLKMEWITYNFLSLKKVSHTVLETLSGHFSLLFYVISYLIRHIFCYLPFYVKIIWLVLVRANIFLAQLGSSWIFFLKTSIGSARLESQFLALQSSGSHCTKCVLQTNIPRIRMVHIYFQNRNELYFHMGQINQFRSSIT